MWNARPLTTLSECLFLLEPSLCGCGRTMSVIQQLMKEHRSETAKLREEQDIRVKEALECMTDVSAVMVDSVNNEICEVFSTQVRGPSDTVNGAVT